MDKTIGRDTLRDIRQAAANLDLHRPDLHSSVRRSRELNSPECNRHLPNRLLVVRWVVLGHLSARMAEGIKVVDPHFKARTASIGPTRGTTEMGASKMVDAKIGVNRTADDRTGAERNRSAKVQTRVAGIYDLTAGAMAETGSLNDHGAKDLIG
jgi:hypothetical protein